MKKFLLILLVMILSNVAHANGDIITSIKVSNDSDYATIQHLDVGYSDVLDNWRIGMFTGRYKILEHNGNNILNESKFTYNRDINKHVSINGDFKSLINSKWYFLAGSSHLGYRPNATWRFDTSIEHNFIDSLASVDKKITFTDYSLSTDYNLSRSTILVGGFSFRSMSDGNRRNSFIGKIVYIPEEFQNFKFETKITKSLNSFDPDEYWAPIDFHQQLLGLSYKAAISKHKLFLRGYEYFGNQSEDHNTSHYLEFGIELLGWIAPKVYANFSASRTETEAYNNSTIGIRLDFVM